jgi:hypothetical protein
MTLSAIIQLYHGGQRSWCKKTPYHVYFFLQIFLPANILRQPELIYHKMKLKELQDKMGHWVNIFDQVCVCRKFLGVIVVVTVW